MVRSYSVVKLMKQLFKKGDTKTFTKIVSPQDIATFESGTVHQVYSTFAIARDAEWSGRLFVLDIKEEDEEGIGTSISIHHKSPALVGETILYEAMFDEITNKGEIINSFIATCGNRIIAEGIQKQRVLKKEKIEAIFKAIH